MEPTRELQIRIDARPTTRTLYAGLPLVYSCSGCSSSAQLANALAVRLDRERIAEMSCIVGIGGGVESLLKVARSRRSMIVLDGCPLHCAKRCIEREGISPDVHIDLSRHGVRKRLHADPPPEEFDGIWSNVVLPAANRLGAEAAQKT